MSVEDGDFQKVFEDIVGYWMDLFPTCPIVLSGMVGSRQGWEAPYRVPRRNQYALKQIDNNRIDQKSGNFFSTRSHFYR